VGTSSSGAALWWRWRRSRGPHQPKIFGPVSSGDEERSLLSSGWPITMGLFFFCCSPSYLFYRLLMAAADLRSSGSTCATSSRLLMPPSFRQTAPSVSAFIFFLLLIVQLSNI
jgi:hypothetical protein